MAIFGARDIAETDMARGLEARHREQRAEMRFGFARALRLQRQRAERLPRGMQIGLHAQRVLERLLGERIGSAFRERAAERELDRRIVGRKIRRAPEMAQRRVEILAFEQQRAETRERLRILARAQRDAEMLLGILALAAHQRDLPETRMRRADVRIERERFLVVRARAVEIARLEAQRAERELDAGLVGRKRVRTRQQLFGFLARAALMAQQAEQMQHLGIVRLPFEMLAVALLGLVETAQAVVFDRFFQHVGRVECSGNPAASRRMTGSGVCSASAAAHRAGPEVRPRRGLANYARCAGARLQPVAEIGNRPPCRAGGRARSSATRVGARKHGAADQVPMTLRVAAVTPPWTRRVRRLAQRRRQDS